jgi:hypothetical protein
MLRAITVKKSSLEDESLGFVQEDAVDVEECEP